MNKELFADAVSAVHMTGNIVRIDLMSLQPHLKSQNGQPVFDVSQRIIMPLDGFVQSFAVMEKAINQMVEVGVLKRNAATVAPTTVTTQANEENQGHE
jgi:hypothetical protein